MELLTCSMGIVSLGSAVKASVDALKSVDPGQQGLHLRRLLTELEGFDLQASLPQQKSALEKDTERLNYLDRLPERALKNIIQYVSDQPRSSAWENFIGASDAHALYCGEGALPDTFRKMFPKIDIRLDPRDKTTTSPKMPFRTKAPMQYVPPTVRLPLKIFGMPLQFRASESGPVDVLKAAGSTITAIRYRGDRERVYPPHMVSWIDPFKKYCTSVEQLEMVTVSVPILEMILSARAGKLKSLRLSLSSCSPAHLHCVSKYCSGLRNLQIAIYQPVPKSLWATLGPTLEELHITLPHISRKPSSSSRPFPVAEMQSVVKCIEDKCRAIRKISITPMHRCLHASVQDLLRSYGDQLVYARTEFCEMKPAICRSIAVACPYAVFDIMHLKRASAIHELNFQVNRVRFEHASELSQTDAALVASNCAEIRTLCFNEQNWEAPITAAAVLQGLKPHLDTLSLDLKEDNLTQVLHQVAAFTCTLRFIRISTKMLCCSGFQNLFKANPLLGRIAIVTCPKETASCINAVVEIINLCTGLRSCRELIIERPKVSKDPIPFRYEDLVRIANACVPLRTRPIQVRAFGVNYI